ncbi:MAG: isoprenylcysteine carboxylmethyltransferase family protein [Nibricoccus sp.]
MKKIIAAVIGVLLFAGLPVLVWRLAGHGAFAAQPARAAYLVVATLLQIAVAVFVPGQGFSRTEGQTVVARQRVAVIFLQLLTIGVVVISPWTDSGATASMLSQPLRYAGLTLFAGGTLLMNWAVVWLGRHFSVQVTLQENHRLVTKGPYKWIRHPRYTGITCCFLGIALVFASVIGFVLWVLLFATLLWRIHDEETLMAAAFPAEWPEYSRKTAKLIPYLV